MTADEDQLRVLFGVLADRQPAVGTDGTWLRERWRRHQARRAGAGLVVVALLAGGGTALALRPDAGNETSLVASPAPSAEPMPSPTAAEASASAAPSYPVPPPLRARTGTRLLVVAGTRLVVLDVDTGDVIAVATDERLQDNERLNALRIGDQIVLVPDNSTGAGGGGGTVFATTAGPGSSLRALGSSDPQITRSARAGRVWLVSIEDTNEPRTTLTEVDLRGRVHQRVVLADTIGAYPLANGFLRDALPADDSPGTELVDADGRRLRYWPGLTYRTSSSGRALLAGDCPDSADRCRLLVLTGGTSVSEQEVSVPRDVALAAVETALTPDGTLLLSPVATTPDGDAAAIQRTDLRAGSTTGVDGALSDRYWGLSPAFSDDGRWMFFIDADDKHLDAYDVESGRVFRVEVPLVSITSVITVS